MLSTTWFRLLALCGLALVPGVALPGQLRGRELASVKVPGGALGSGALALDDKTLATGSGDGTIRLWGLVMESGAAAARPADGGKRRPAVVREIIPDDARHANGRLLRITGKVTVEDANTLRFEDGTRVMTSGGIDAPDLGQRALLGDQFYPCGREAANFLRKLIGDRPVSFYAFGVGNGRDAGKRLGGVCFVGETDLGTEVVRNGWAISHHSGVTPYETFARENKRGLWRGRFVLPERWRAGQRLPGEPPDREAEVKAFAALAAFVPKVRIGWPGNRVTAIEFTANRRRLTDDDLRHLKEFAALRSVDLRATAITDAGLDHLAVLRDLTEVGLDWTGVTPAGVVRLVKGRSTLQGLAVSGVPFRDGDLAELKGLADLRSLGLRGSSVTDAGLAHLKPFAKLRVLSLMSTAVGDAGLKRLEGLTSLEDLDLDRTAVTDAGMVHLKPLVNLQRLQLAFTSVTDAGLVHLQALRNLRELNLRGTAVTAEGVDRLRRRLPDVRVGFGPAPR
jgi:endonuclease YncB( thermonuclease family)